MTVARVIFDAPPFQVKYARDELVDGIGTEEAGEGDETVQVQLGH